MKTSTVKLFFSVILGVIVTTIIGIPAFLITLYRKRGETTAYLYNVAISIDELGGTLLYGVKDKTVSYMTGLYMTEGKVAAQIFGAVIDLLFGKNHCLDVYNSK